MISDLEKYFPRHSPEQIKEEVELFKQVYDEVKNNVSQKVWDIIEENDFEKKVITQLQKHFPWYNKRFILALKNRVDNTTSEQLLDEIIEWLCKEKTTCSLLDPNYLQDPTNSRAFLKTAKSMWVLDDDIEDADDLSDRNTKPTINPSAYNYKENYKKRLGWKLLLCEWEINNMTLEALENKIAPYIELAITHVITVLDSISSTNKIDLKSAYFREIHSQEKTPSFFTLFKLYYKLEKERKKFSKEKDSNIYDNHINQIKIWQYEIQRIFALAVLYIRRKHNLTYQNAKEEQDFLISKLAEIWSQDFKSHYIDSNITDSDNDLYNYTKTIEQYCNLNLDWSYECFQTANPWSMRVKFNTFEMEWKFRNYDKVTNKLKLLHVWSRVKKNAFSSVEKLIRKRLSSFNEILDHKWFIFVLESFNDYWKLKKILEYEFWSLTTSWIEENKSMKEWWNKDTDWEYDCRKWVLKVNYKWKLIKEFFNLLWSFLEKKNYKELSRELELLKQNSNWDDSFYKLSQILRKVKDEKLHKHYNNLKEKIWEQRYFIEVEIQIFDLQNYIKAEIDENSPAYHWKYKWVQWLETMPYYFPKEVYWNTTKHVLIEELPKTNKYAYLNDMNNYSRRSTD